MHFSKNKALYWRKSGLSKKGEEMLKEVLDDVKKGKVKKFKNVEGLINDLHK